MLSFLLSLPLLLSVDAEPTPSVLVVVGAPGTDEYGKQFREWAERWRQAAARGQAECAVIGLDKGDDADRALLKQQLNQAISNPKDMLWLVLIGHGTFDGKTARFNLRGPDVASQELAEWLKPLKRPLAIINCASASGPFIHDLSGPNRVVVTATKSGFEHNFARFGDYLSKAMADPQADLDKDEQTSLLEAFLLASAGAQEFYAADARLATEHALVDDNGDALGTPADWFQGVRAVKTAKEGASPDGRRASQVQLVPSAREASLPAEVSKERDEIERQISELRDKKAHMPEDEYYVQLEALLVKMARLYESFDQAAETQPVEAAEKVKRQPGR